MRYLVDHDFHLHSRLSSCSSDPKQTASALLDYAERSGYRHLCLTDHYWDERVPGPSDWYAPQNTAHVRASLPLPERNGIRFHFGCETELRKDLTLGISREALDEFDFVIIPTTHLHMRGFTISEENWSDDAARARLYEERFRALLKMDLPFRKIGLAHITCPLISGHERTRQDALSILNRIPDATFRDLFSRAAETGIGIEINTPIETFSSQDLEDELRVYRIARDSGCRFYFGSDAHHPADLLPMPKRFELMVDCLGLTEDQKFDPFHD